MAQKKKPAALALVPATRPRVRLGVQKTYKLFVGGNFIRSESGRYFQVKDTHGKLDNIARGSRKDGRDAVKAAHAAWAGWSGRTAYNRGQILYRLAEVMESRRTELIEELSKAGASRADAEAELDLAIDRVVVFAGWTDKYQSLLASSNPVAGPHFGFSVPESMGVVAAVAPDAPSLLGLVTVILPIVASGNTVVVVASERDPRTALTFAECLATSDLPGGVVNVLAGQAKEIAPHLAKHQEVAALDVWTDDAELAKSLSRDGVATVKRVRTHRVAGVDFADEAHEGLYPIERFVETKSVWHPAGM